MPCELLVKAWNMPNGTRKGSITTIYDQPVEWGSGQTLPDFVQLVITDATKSQVTEYTRGWMTVYDYEVVTHNVSLDGYRIRLWSRDANVSGENNITKAQVENYLEGWNGVFVSASSNEVVFDFGIYEAATSIHFWGQYDLVSFQEVSYDPQGTGVHVIDGDYSGYPLAAPEKIERICESMGGVIVYHDIPSKVIRYSIGRQLITSRLKIEVNDKLAKRFEMRRYLFTEASVDTVIIQGGRIERTKAQALTNLRDRMTE